MKLTKPQREAIIRARDFGSAHYYRAPQVGGCAMPARASRTAMVAKLHQAGLLTHFGAVTEAGRAAVAA